MLGLLGVFRIFLRGVPDFAIICITDNYCKSRIGGLCSSLSASFAVFHATCSRKDVRQKCKSFCWRKVSRFLDLFLLFRLRYRSTSYSFTFGSKQHTSQRFTQQPLQTIYHRIGRSLATRAVLYITDNCSKSRIGGLCASLSLSFVVIHATCSPKDVRQKCKSFCWRKVSRF